MTGHLHLDFASRGGVTVLREQSFRAPMHISKAYWDGSCLIVNAVNPTAGLFAGDRVETTVRVRSGASAVLTSPSATRVHPARGPADAASIRQTITVEDGGWLDLCPEILIPHRGSRLTQSTRIELAGSGGILAIEMLAPGRVAFGETFVFAGIENTLELRVDGQLLLRERHRLSPDGDGLAGLRRHFPAGYYASALLVAPAGAIDRDFHEAISALGTSSAVLGSSNLAPRAAIVKVLAADSISLRRAVAGVRGLVHQLLGRAEPKLRKL